MKHIILHGNGGKLPAYDEYQFSCKYKMRKDSRPDQKVRCGRRFIDEDRLIVHESLKHTNAIIKVYCGICGLAFASIASKAAHV